MPFVSSHVPLSEFKALNVPVDNFPRMVLLTYYKDFTCTFTAAFSFFR